LSTAAEVPAPSFAVAAARGVILLARRAAPEVPAF